LINGMAIISQFNQDLLITALQIDQAGKSTFPEFLISLWIAGVINYDIDFNMRTITYYGARGESYQESYPAINIGEISFVTTSN
jgi:uncharacterized protein YbcV (DUF1398 family)